ncbi:MAG: hypothetical protein ACXVPY_10565 [Bacteroidia bacterium]
MLATIFLFGTLLTSKGDTLLCNIKKTNTDRILLYDRDCFIWIRQHIIVDDNELIVTYGQYKSIGDTIYFNYPDSTRLSNKYFCYSSTKYNSEKNFHFYNIPETYPPFSSDRVYKALFKTKTPNLGETTFFEKFRAIKRDGKIIIEDGLYEDSKFSEFISDYDTKK